MTTNNNLQRDIFSPTYLTECPGCGQEFDIRPRQGVYRGGRHRKYCSDRCRKTAKRRDERLQAAITRGSTPQPVQLVHSQKTAQGEPSADVSNQTNPLPDQSRDRHHAAQTQTGQLGIRTGQGQEWWYLIEDQPGGVGQIGPLLESQAYRLLERLRNVAATTTPNQTVGALPALYHASSLAAALDLHQRQSRRWDKAANKKAITA